MNFMDAINDLRTERDRLRRIVLAVADARVMICDEATELGFVLDDAVVNDAKNYAEQAAIAQIRARRS